ncbi:MAG: hypothetical protein N2259_03210 [Patescibacteria group bacterium]|nr:hypothetical protein [Patescibacteria group bacterium]
MRFLKKIVVKNPHLPTILTYFFLSLFALFFFNSLQSLATLNDPDSFYHAKMASLLSQGNLVKEFPWLPFTILKDYYANHHFLYHLFLIPFVKFYNPLIGIKIATIFFASLATVIFYWLCRKFKIKFSFVFAFLLFTSPMFLVRMSLAKAPSAALTVLFLGLYALFKKKYFLLLIISFLYVWLYNTWPILFVAVIIYCFSVALKKMIENWLLFRDWRLKIKKFFQYLFNQINVKLFFCSLGGFVGGLIFNPYFPQNLFFNWVHIVKIGIINLQSKIGVGAEWYPYDVKDLIFNSPFVCFLFFLASAWFLVSFKKLKNNPYFGQKAKTLSLFILSWLFFLYTIKSRRNIEYFVPFALFFSGLSFKKLFTLFDWRSYFQKFKSFFSYPFSILTVILLVMISLILQFGVAYFLDRAWLGTQKRLEIGIPFEKYKKVSDWLKENTKPGEIIFHSSWDDFPMLFYWNDRNRYIIGLDTTFMYERNPDLYWDWEKISFGKTKENLAQILQEKFHSSYIHVRPDRKALEENLQADKNFEKVYEDEEGKVYRIKR